MIVVRPHRPCVRFAELSFGAVFGIGSPELVCVKTVSNAGMNAVQAETGSFACIREDAEVRHHSNAKLILEP